MTDAQVSDEDAPLLRMQNVRASYGDTLALSDVSISVAHRGVVAVLGANGAGKTTLLRVISGLVPVSAGTMHYGGRDVTRTDSTEAVRRHRIAHVPEGRQVFPDLTVEENLRMGGLHRRGAELEAVTEQVCTYFPRLRERWHQRAGTLSGGEQQMLVIGRALMSGPRLLLLDEPSLGLAPIITRLVFENIVQIAGAEDVAVLLVEQNAALALKVADYAYVINNGRVGLEGSAAELQENDRVRDLYLRS